jgi:hypothetical protein
MYLGKFGVISSDTDSEPAAHHLANRHRNLLLLIVTHICDVHVTQEICKLMEMV